MKLKHKKIYFTIAIIALAVVVYFGAGIYSRNHSPQITRPKNGISIDKAKEIIQQCGAIGTYDIGGIDVGIILKDHTYQYVNGLDEAGRYSLQSNPACPMTEDVVS